MPNTPHRYINNNHIRIQDTMALIETKAILKLTVYEVVPKDYDGNSDDTDHLIKWVAASNTQEVEDLCRQLKVQSPYVYTIADIPPLSPAVDYIIVEGALL